MNQQLKLACAGAALVGVWGSAEADTTLTLTTNETLTSATGFFYHNSSVYRDDDSTRTLLEHDFGTLNAAPDPANPIVLPVDEQGGMPVNPRFSYTVLGIYDEASDGVAVLLKPEVAANAISLGLQWDQVFSSSNAGYVSESDMATRLRGNYLPGAGPFEFAYGYESLLPSWNQEATLVYFSGATYGGTGFAAAPVPEPASMATLALGALGLLRRRRA